MVSPLGSVTFVFHSHIKSFQLKVIVDRATDITFLSNAMSELNLVRQIPAICPNEHTASAEMVRVDAGKSRSEGGRRRLEMTRWKLLLCEQISVDIRLSHGQCWTDWMGEVGVIGRFFCSNHRDLGQIYEILVHAVRYEAHALGPGTGTGTSNQAAKVGPLDEDYWLLGSL